MQTGIGIAKMNVDFKCDPHREKPAVSISTAAGTCASATSRHLPHASSSRKANVSLFAHCNPPGFYPCSRETGPSVSLYFSQTQPSLVCVPTAFSAIPCFLLSCSRCENYSTHLR